MTVQSGFTVRWWRSLTVLALGAACGGTDPSDPGNGTEGLLDSIPPTIVTMPPPAGTRSVIVPGETLGVALTAEDNIAVAWAGYRLGPPISRQDSGAGRGRSVTLAFTVGEVQESWVGQHPLTLFAWDCTDPVGRCETVPVGNLTQVVVGSLDVVPLTPHAITARPLPGWVFDWAYDAKRNRVYLSQRDSLRILVLDLATADFLAPIPVPHAPHGLDLVPGDDSLLVAFRQTTTLGVFDLTQPSPTRDSIVLTFDPSMGRGPNTLRVAANRKVLVGLTFTGSGFGGRVWEVDLPTGEQRQRVDVGISGEVTPLVPLSRSADRGTILAVIDDACCPLRAQVYDAATDGFGPLTPVFNDFFPEHAVSADGSRILVEAVVFDRTLSPVASIDPADFGFDFGYRGPRTLSPDGSTVYVATGYGYIAVGTGGTLVERVRLPGDIARHLLITPDGATLVARTDLTTLVPANPQVFIVRLQ